MPTLTLAKIIKDSAQMLNVEVQVIEGTSLRGKRSIKIKIKDYFDALGKAFMKAL